MLNLSKSTISRSIERPLAEGYTVTAEGQALVGAIVNGIFGVHPSTGAAGEKFMGVSIAQQLTLEYLPQVERLGVPASGALEVNLKSIPVAGSLRVVVKGGTVVDTADYGVTGLTVTFTGTVVAGDIVEIAYRYSPSVIEAKTIQGDIPPGGAAALLLNSVGVIEVGDIFTSEFDTSADWSGSSPVVRLGPNGLFTTAGSGSTVNAVVIQIPTTSDSLLGLRIV